MSDDFGDFMSIVGTEVPIFRACQECGDIYIVDPGSFTKPKTECDPEWCPNWVPMCECRDDILWREDQLALCDYPDCTKCDEPLD